MKIYEKCSYIPVIITCCSLFTLTIFTPTLAQNSHPIESVPYGDGISGEGKKVNFNDDSMNKDHEGDQGNRGSSGGGTGEWTSSPVDSVDSMYQNRIKEWISREEGGVGHKIIGFFKNQDSNSRDVQVRLADQSLRHFRFSGSGELEEVGKMNPGDRKWTHLSVGERNGISQGGQGESSSSGIWEGCKKEIKKILPDNIGDKIFEKEAGEDQRGRDEAVPRSQFIRIAAYADSSYRRGHPGWREDIRMLVRELSERSRKAIGVGMEIVHVQEIEKNLNVKDISVVREAPLSSFAHVKVAFTGNRGGPQDVGLMGLADQSSGKWYRPLATVVHAGHPSEFGAGMYAGWDRDVFILQHELTHNLGERHVDCGSGSYRNVMCPSMREDEMHPHWSSDQIQRMRVMARDWLSTRI